MKFIEEKFPSKNIHSFELKKDDFNAHKNTLHLDCCFQPLGRNHLLIHENSFKNISDLSFFNDYSNSNKIDTSIFIDGLEHNKIIFINGRIEKIDFGYEDQNKIEVSDETKENNLEGAD